VLWFSLSTCAAHAEPYPTLVMPRAEARGLVRADAAHVDSDSPLGQARAALAAGDAARARALADAADSSERPLEAGLLFWVAGRAAAQAGDAEGAKVCFATVAEAADHPLAPWAALEHAELLRSTDPAAAAEEAGRLVLDWPGATRARQLEALALLDAGRADEALPKLRALVAETPDRIGAATVGMPLAALLAARPEADARVEALALYRRVATRAPRARVGVEAAQLATRVLATLPDALREALARIPDEDRLAEADALYESMRHEAAAAAYREIAESTEDREVLCRARLMQGRALERARDRHEAAALLADVAERCVAPDVRAWARYKAGRTLQAIGEREAALAHFLALPDETPAHRLADDGLFLAARLYEDEGEATEARALLERLAADFVDGDMRGEALFRLAWTARKAERWEEALGYLDALSADPNADQREDLLGRADYWRARTLADAGRAGDATRAYEALARRFPLAFYAQLALAKLSALAPDRAEAVRSAMRPVPLEGALTFERRPGLDWAAVDRAVALLKVGERALAEDELEAFGAFSEPTEPDRLWLAAALLDGAGESIRAMRLVRAHHALFRGAMPVGASHALWRIAYPPAYRPLIEEAAARESLPPSLVRAIAREESSFEPSAVSHARAYGLIQIILPTARAQATDLGIVPTPARLRDPEVNLRFGTHFMAALMRRYASCQALIPAAYNAGPGAVDRWLRGREGGAFDELVEEIPYDETRRYARRVLQSYGVYSWLETGQLPELPEHLPR
jgi:soluble lytic murein transglycosylase